MKVIEAFGQGRPTLSFEFFPPKTIEQEQHLFEVIAELKRFKPDFVSVTYGAMGTSREKSFFWVNKIKQLYQIEPVAHLTCIAAAKNDIAMQLNELEKLGAQNILALRGDPPENQKDFTPPADGFRLAKDLIAFIKKNKPSFCLGCAGYPEGHCKSPNLEKDTGYLKAKIDAGAEYIITQLFFDNRYFFEFTRRCEKAGIKAPLLPGLMPITSFQQINRLTGVCGTTIPAPLMARLDQFKDDPAAIQKISAEHTVAQARELLKSGIPGLHFFVMNQAGPITQVLNGLNLDRK